MQDEKEVAPSFALSRKNGGVPKTSQQFADKKEKESTARMPWQS
jgi:hypothetical protein